MLILKILEQEVKQFMSLLIKDDKFDFFETRGIEINSFTKINFSCTLDKNFFNTDDELGDYCTWAMLKPYVFNIIKGAKRPKTLKIIFSLKTPETLHDNAKALFLNISFDNNIVLCTTATSQINFTMDKYVDMAWEEYIQKFFSSLGIAFIKE